MNKSFITVFLSIIILSFYPMNCFAQEDLSQKKVDQSNIIKSYDENTLYIQSKGFFMDVVKGNTGATFSEFDKNLETLITSSNLAKEDFKNYQWKSTLGYSLYVLGLATMFISPSILAFVNVKEISDISSITAYFITSIIILIGGVVISSVGIYFRENGVNDFSKSIWKYNKDFMFKNLSDTTNKESNNINLLNYSLKF